MPDPSEPKRAKPESRGRGRGAGRGRSATPADDLGLLAEVVPLVHDGLVVMRTLLDVAIQRLEEIEEGRVVHVRRETFEAVLDVLDQEIAQLDDQEATAATTAQLDALRSLRTVIERQLRRATQPRKPAEGKRKGNGDTPKPRKRSVTID